MEKQIVEEIGFINEELYQKIKKEMNKKDDYFTSKELIIFTDFYRNPGEI